MDITAIWTIAGVFVGSTIGYLIGHMSGYSKGREDGWHHYHSIRNFGDSEDSNKEME